MNQKIYSIYRATNNINGKPYIGYTGNFECRLKSHRKNVEKGTKSVFYNAIRKYGWDSFIWEIIYQSKDKNHTKQEMEGFFIEEYNTHIANGCGYNMTCGGDGSNGLPDASRLKMGWSRGLTLGPYSPERGIAISKAKKAQNIKISEEQKEAIRRKLLGSKMPESCIRKKSKDYEAISPDGEIFNFYNLNRFCKEKGLNQGAMAQVSLGKVKQHKGWKVKVIQPI